MDDQKLSKSRVIGFRPSPEIVAQLEAVASAREWSMSHTAERACALGIAGLFGLQSLRVPEDNAA